MLRSDGVAFSHRSLWPRRMGTAFDFSERPVRGLAAGFRRPSCNATTLQADQKVFIPIGLGPRGAGTIWASLSPAARPCRLVATPPLVPVLWQADINARTAPIPAIPVSVNSFFIYVWVGCFCLCLTFIETKRRNYVHGRLGIRRKSLAQFVFRVSPALGE